MTRRKNGTARRPSLREHQRVFKLETCSCRTQKRPAFSGYSCSCHPRNEKQLGGRTSFSEQTALWPSGRLLCKISGWLLVGSDLRADRQHWPPRKIVSCPRNKHIFRCDQNGPP